MALTVKGAGTYRPARTASETNEDTAGGIERLKSISARSVGTASKVDRDTAGGIERLKSISAPAMLPVYTLGSTKDSAKEREYVAGQLAKGALVDFPNSVANTVGSAVAGAIGSTAGEAPDSNGMLEYRKAGDDKKKYDKAAADYVKNSVFTANIDAANKKAASFAEGLRPGPLLAGDLANNMGRMLPTVLVTTAAGAAGAPAALTKLISSSSVFAESYSNALKRALDEGADERDAGAYALLSASVEAGGDQLIGGVAGLGEGVIDSAAKGAVKKAASKIFNGIKSPAIRQLLGTAGKYVAKNVIGEAIEEGLQSLGDTAAKRATYDKDAEYDLKGAAYEALLGGMMGGIFGVSEIPSYSYEAYAKESAKAGVVREKADSAARQAVERAKASGERADFPVVWSAAYDAAFKSAVSNANLSEKRASEFASAVAARAAVDAGAELDTVRNAASAKAAQEAAKPAQSARTDAQVNTAAGAAMAENGGKAASTAAQNSAQPAQNPVQPAQAPAQPTTDAGRPLTDTELAGELSGVWEGKGSAYAEGYKGGGEDSSSGVDAAARTGEEVGASREQIAEAQRLSQVTGRRVEFYAAEPKSGGIENGYYANGVIYINALGGDTVSQIFAHELTHGVEKTKAFAGLRDTVFDMMKQDGLDVDLERQARIRLYRENGVTLDAAGADAELVARYVQEKLLSDENAISDFVARKSTLGRRILDWITEMLARVTGRKEQAFLLRAERYYAKALRQAEAGKAAWGAENSGKYSINPNYSQNVDAVLNGTYNSAEPLIIGRTPKVLTDIGLASLPVMITPSHVYSIAKTEAEAKAEGKYRGNVNYHGLGGAAVKEIMNKISNPIMIIAHPDFTEAKKRGRDSAHKVIVLVDLSVDGKQVIAPIVIDEQVKHNGTHIDTNQVATYFGKSDIKKIITEAIALENIGEVGFYYGHKKRIQDFVKNLGHQLPAIFKDISNPDTIIRSINGNVNRKLSNVTQSQQFLRWFGDWQNNPAGASKIVNDDGTPKVVYHGSPVKGITEFDKKRIGTNTDDGVYGSGFYFTSNKKQAEQYVGSGGKVYEVYLSLKKPLVLSDFKTVKELAEYLDMFEGQLTAQGGVIRPLTRWIDRFNSAVEARGHDGIIVNHGDSDEIVVYEPTQIKSATDNIGTFDGSNPDIRYSIDKPSSPNSAERAKVYTIDSTDSGGVGVDYSAETDDVSTVDVPEGRRQVAGKLNDGGKQAENTDLSDPDGAPFELETPDERVRRAAKREAEAQKLTLDNQKLSARNAEVVRAERRRDEISHKNKQFTADINSSLNRAYMPPKLLYGLADFAAAMDNPNKNFAVAMRGLYAAYSDAIGFAGEGRGFKLDTLNAVDRYFRRVKDKPYDKLTSKELDTLSEIFDRVAADCRGYLEYSQKDVFKIRDYGAMEAAHADGTYFDKMQTVYKMRDRAKSEWEAWKGSDKDGARLAKSKYDGIERYIGECKRYAAARRNVDAENHLSGDLTRYKDKSVGLFYDRETAERNTLDVFGAEDGAALNRDYFKRVHMAEQASNLYQERAKKKIAELNISDKKTGRNIVSESYAIQFVGEHDYQISASAVSGWHDGHSNSEYAAELSDFIKANPDFDYADIRRKAKEFAGLYEEMIQMANRVLVQNGYDPVRARGGYFPHISELRNDSLLGAVAALVGVDPSPDLLSTTINGATAAFRPGKPYFANFNERKSGDFTYDALAGFDRYLEGVCRVIYQTENIRRLRSLASVIRASATDEGINAKINEIKADETLDANAKDAALSELYAKGKYALSGYVVWLDEYTNLLAGKKSKYDRNMESLFGRRAYTFTRKLYGRIAANLVGGNIATALTNTIPIAQVSAEVGWKYARRGMAETCAALKNGDWMQDASAFIVNRRGTEPLSRTAMQKLSDKASWLTNAIDSFAAGTVVRARYYANLDAGMDSASALSEADDYAASLIGDRSRGAQPNIFHAGNPLAKLATAFQLEPNNEISHLFKDIPREKLKDGVGKLVLLYFKYALFAYLYNTIVESITGRRPAYDPIELLNDVQGEFTGYKVPNFIQLLGDCAIEGRAPAAEDFVKAGTKKSVPKKFLGAAAELVNFAGNLPFVGPFTGGGRVFVSSAVPDVASFAAAAASGAGAKKIGYEAYKTIGKPLLTVLPPVGGSQLIKTAEGISAVAKSGKWNVENDGGETLQYPVHKDNPVTVAGDYLRGALFGKSSFATAGEWTDTGFKKLSRNASDAYRELVREGDSSSRKVYAALGAVGTTDSDGKVELARRIKNLSGQPLRDSDKAVIYRYVLATDKEKEVMDALPRSDSGEVYRVVSGVRLANSGDKSAKAKGIRDAFAGSKLSDEVKLTIYGGLVSESFAREIRVAMDAGIGFDDYIKAYTGSAGNAEEKETKKTGAAADPVITDISKLRVMTAAAGDSAAAVLGRVMKPEEYADLTRVTDAGGDAAAFLDACEFYNKAKGDTDVNGKTVVSKKEKVMEFINGLEVSREVKDALYLGFYSEKTIDDAPWRKSIGGSGRRDTVTARK